MQHLNFIRFCKVSVSYMYTNINLIFLWCVTGTWQQNKQRKLNLFCTKVPPHKHVLWHHTFSAKICKYRNCSRGLSGWCLVVTIVTKVIYFGNNSSDFKIQVWWDVTVCAHHNIPEDLNLLQHNCGNHKCCCWFK
jgi:hypothetical protein